MATLAVPLIFSGCSGINSTHSVSPASFFLPGLLKADPPPPPDAVSPAMMSDSRIAQAS